MPARGWQTAPDIASAAPMVQIIYTIMRNKPFLAILAAAAFGLAGCNPPAARSQANFNAAGQALGAGNVGAGATDTGHAFADGAEATGQAISTTANQAGHAISNAFSGN